MGTAGRAGSRAHLAGPQEGGQVRVSESPVAEETQSPGLKGVGQRLENNLPSCREEAEKEAQPHGGLLG